MPPAAPSSSVTTTPRTTVSPALGGQGSVITVQGGPNATANIPGPHNDAADFWGSGLVILVIIGAIALTRLVFRRRPDPRAEESYPAPGPTPGPGGEDPAGG